MTATIEVTPGEEAWLAEQAEQQGVAPAEIIKQLIDAQLPGSAPPETSASVGKNADVTAALFAQWAKEDATRTPEEALADDKLWREFERGINDTRRALGMRQL